MLLLHPIATYQALNHLFNGVASLLQAPAAVTHAGGDSTSLLGLNRLCKTVAALASLQLLSLIHCRLGPYAADALSEIILKNRCSL